MDAGRKLTVLAAVTSEAAVALTRRRTDGKLCGLNSRIFHPLTLRTRKAKASHKTNMEKKFHFYLSSLKRVRARNQICICSNLCTVKPDWKWVTEKQWLLWMYVCYG